LNGLREEIFRVPVYSKPSISHTWAFDRCHDLAGAFAVGGFIRTMVMDPQRIDQA
jgi:hypothetical protein